MCAEAIQFGRFNLSTFNYRLSTYSHAGLYDFPAREYSIQGRWPSPDPAGLAAVDPSNPQSWNRYAYVMNNPLVFTDPTGLVCDGGDQTMWDTLANGTGIFTQDDCTANGGTWEGPAAGTILTDPTYVTADPLPSPWAPWGPDLSGILTGSSGGGNSGGGIRSALHKAVTAACSAVPDVSTLGLGFDVGIPFGSPGFSGGIAANGASGELSLTGTTSINVGLILPDAYAYLGTVFKAPTNASLNSSMEKPDAPQVTVGGERFGFSATPNSLQLTAGPSFSPVTFAFGGSVTKTRATIPYLGYVLQPGRAICKAITGK